MRKPYTRNPNIDIGLSALIEHSEPGRDRMTVDEIAEVCGCSGTAIKNIQASAIDKIKKELKRRGIEFDDLIG